MATQSLTDLTGLEKASVLLMALGTEVCAQVFKHLNELEIEKLSSEIMKMRDVDPELVQAVVNEFTQVCASGGIAGRDFAASVLEQVVGNEKAGELLKRASGPKRIRPFESLTQLSTEEIKRAVSHEHPQVIALVLANLPIDKSADVLSGLDPATQTDVAYRICTTDEVDLDIIAAIEEALHANISASGTQAAASGGPKSLAEILNMAGRSTERVVLEALQKSDPACGEQVRSMMFLFEDLCRLEDRMVQIVLREIDQEDLRLALKGADDDIKDLVFRNMSERAAETMKEDLELTGPVKVREIEAAQQRIVAVVKQLLATGKIDLATVEEEQAA